MLETLLVSRTTPDSGFDVVEPANLSKRSISRHLPQFSSGTFGRHVVSPSDPIKVAINISKISLTDTMSTAGSENTFARDRGGPDPNNEGPHATSIANKLDPKVDSDGDGKPKSGPNDLESTSGFGSTSSQTGITGKPISSSNDATSSSIGDTTSSTTKNTTSDYSSSGLTNRPGTTGNTTSSSTGLPPAGSNTATSSGNLPIRGEDMNAPGAAQASGGHIRPEHDQDKTGVTSVHSTSAVPNTATGSSANASTAGGVGTTGGVEPSVGAAPESGSAPSQKQQGADRPGQEPNAEQTSAIKDKKDMAEKAQGGDDKSGAPLGTIDHGEGSKKEDEDEGSSKEKGTGEIWIKSTGMAAEGGDFDAERAGAGKEADRES